MTQYRLFTQPQNPDTLTSYISKRPFSCQSDLDLPDYLYFQKLEREQMKDACIRVPVADESMVIESIDEELDQWAENYTKRRQIEKDVVRYLREQVAPLGILDNIESIAAKLDHCRESGYIGVRKDTGGKIAKWEYKCGQVKLCPDEARQEQQRLSKQYVEAAHTWLKEKPLHRTFQYAVFTVKNPKLGDLGKTINAEFKRLRDLLRTKHFKHVQGAFITLEDPLAKVYTDEARTQWNGEYSWNVHFNVLLLIDGPFSWEEIRKEWAFNIEFQNEKQLMAKTMNRFPDLQHDRLSVLRCAFQEIIKYVAKHITGKNDQLGLTDWPPGAFCEWWMAHHGLRRSRSYGVLYAADKPIPEYLDFNQIVWCGSVKYSFATASYLIKKRPVAIGSIQENNSTFLKPENPGKYHSSGGGGKPDV